MPSNQENLKAFFATSAGGAKAKPAQDGDLESFFSKDRVDAVADEELTTAQKIGVTANAFGAQFNRFLTRLPGIPFDAVDVVSDFLEEKTGFAPVRKALSEATGGFLPAEVPKFRGSEKFERAANIIGIPTRTGREGTPQELASERIAGRVGEELGASLPFIGLVGRAAGRLGAAQRAGAPLRAAAQARPVATALAEGGLAASAGLGAGLAGEVVGPDASPGARTAADVAGALTGAFTPSVVGRGVSELVRGASAIKGQISPSSLLEGGAPSGTFAEQEAADLIQRAATNRGEALVSLEEGQAAVKAGDIIGEPTAAQLTDDTGLLDLEKTINATDPVARAAAEDSTRALNRGLTETLNKNAGVASAQVAQEFIEGRVDRIVTMLNKRTEQAVTAAKDQLEAIGPNASAADASAATRTELDLAHQSARVDESKLWQAIDDTVLSDTTPMSTAYADMKAAAKKADQAENIPDFDDLFVGDGDNVFAGAEPIGEIQAFRSRVLQDIRLEAAKDVPNKRLLSNLGDLQESALNAMGAAERTTFGPEGAKIRAALDFSTVLNDTYTRGPIGKILRLDARGGQKITDEQALETLFKAGTGGRTSMRALLTAGGGSQQLLASTEDFIKNQFAEMTVNPATGRVNPTARKQFLKKFGPALDEFPQLKAQIEDAVSAQEIAVSRSASNDNRVRGLANTAKSKAALFLDQEPEKAMARVLNNRRPEAAMKQLVRQVGKDGTGEALGGLKTMFAEEVFRRASTKGPDGVPVFDGPAFRKMVDDPRVVKAMKALYKDDPAALKRIQIMDKSIRVAERSLRGKRIADVGGDVSFLVSAFGRILGTKLAPKIGIGALVGAGIGAQISKRVLGNMSERQITALIEAAINDPRIMETLLTLPTRANERVLRRKLRGHLINIGGQLTGDPREQEQSVGR